MSRRNDVARIEGEITIGRPVEAVFDYVADQTNEPQYDPNMVRAEKVTAGPIGKGTRFGRPCGRQDAPRKCSLRTPATTGQRRGW